MQWILKLLRACGGLVVIRGVNRVVRKLAAFTHRVQFALEWQAGLTANWFDHYLEVYYMWSRTRVPLGVERGTLGLLAVRPGARVLELCCGDGFYSHFFYSGRAREVLAVDIDPAAIASARSNYNAPNVRYEVVDIVRALPDGEFDNVVWDSALEYFTADELAGLLKGISTRLAPGGVLSGHVIIQKDFNEGQKYAFTSKEDFLSLVRPCFPNIRTFETLHNGRRSLYFYAGSGALPFDSTWERQ